MIINIIRRIHWMWHVLMIEALIVSICHGIQFHKWWLCGEWFIGCCIMMYAEHKCPTIKKEIKKNGSIKNSAAQQ